MHEIQISNEQFSLNPEHCIEAVENVCNTLGESSRRGYLFDMQEFVGFLVSHSLPFTRTAMISYRNFLQQKFPNNNTAARKWTAASRFVSEYIHLEQTQYNPMTDLKGFKRIPSNKHKALSLEEILELLQQVDRSTVIGKRNYAILHILFRMGLRRSECAGLQLKHLYMKRKMHILLLEDTKNKENVEARMPDEVYDSVQEYLRASGRVALSVQAPLFVQFNNNDTVRQPEKVIDDRSIYRIVNTYGKLIGISDLTAHSTRTSIITLLLEAGEPMQKVMDVARHKDPKTTINYHKRLHRLEDSAVLHIKF